jgi:hypothetical protein
MCHSEGCLALECMLAYSLPVSILYWVVVLAQHIPMRRQGNNHTMSCKMS